MHRLLISIMLLFSTALLCGAQESIQLHPDERHRFILIEELETGDLEYFSSYIRSQETVLAAFRATLPVEQDYMPMIQIDYLIFEFLPTFGFEYPAVESVPHRSTRWNDEIYVLIMADANAATPYCRMMIYYDGTVSAMFYPLPDEVIGVWYEYTLDTPAYIAPGQFVSLYGLHERESNRLALGNTGDFFGNFLHLGTRTGQFLFDVAISHSAGLEKRP